MHPNCRCSTAAWEDSEEYDAWVDYLANGGTTEEWEKQRQEYRFMEHGHDIRSAEISKSFIESSEYREKFDALGEEEKITGLLYQESKKSFFIEAERDLRT